MITYKMDVIQALKDKGYTTYKIRKDKIFGTSTVEKLKKGEYIAMPVLNALCKLLDCQPADILQYVPDIEENENSEDIATLTD